MTDALLVLALLVGAATVLWRRGVRAAAVAVGVVAVLPALTVAWGLPGPLGAAGLLLLVVAGWHGWGRTSSTVTRWSARSRRKAGVASTLDVARHAGTWAMRRRTATVRPSLAALPWRLRLRVPTSQVAVELCRTGGQRVWASIEDVTLIFGGPRTGKTGYLAARILDAPGMTLATSTRTDLLSLCGPLRARQGPVRVFNAVGLGGVESTITFDPLTGCTDPVTAGERAIDMIGANTTGDSGDRAYWEGQARRVLAALLHAAALGDVPMSTLQMWVADPDRAARDVPALLRRSGVQAFEQDALQFITTNDRTRTSITSTLMPALGWLTHPAAVAAATPDGDTFDVAELLASRATVFLLGAEEAHTAPLVCALTGHIAREARRLAATTASGRLDPPLTLALDEAALISPVPLESWTADMGGRGVTILAAFQSRAQLLARWGVHKTATILNNTGAVLLFGGTRDRDDLQFWATLSGERDERTTTTDLHGRVASRSVRRIPVLSPGQIANLPARTVICYRRGLDPVIGRARMAWRRSDVRAHQRAQQRAQRRQVWPGYRPADVRVAWAAGLQQVRSRLARRRPHRDDPAARVDPAPRDRGDNRDYRRGRWSA